MPPKLPFVNGVSRQFYGEFMFFSRFIIKNPGKRRFPPDSMPDHRMESFCIQKIFSALPYDKFKYILLMMQKKFTGGNKKNDPKPQTG
jgi:hypothetical protein